MSFSKDCEWMGVGGPGVQPLHTHTFPDLVPSPQGYLSAGGSRGSRGYPWLGDRATPAMTSMSSFKTHLFDPQKGSFQGLSGISMYITFLIHSMHTITTDDRRVLMGVPNPDSQFIFYPKSLSQLSI